MNPRHKIKPGKFYIIILNKLIGYPCHEVEVRCLLKAISTDYYDCTFDILAAEEKMENPLVKVLKVMSSIVQQAQEINKTDLPLCMGWPWSSEKYAEIIKNL